MYPFVPRINDIHYGQGKNEARTTFEEFKTAYHTNKAVTIGVLGDSTSMGYCANPGPNTWANGLAYRSVNLPDGTPNLISGNPLEIHTLQSPAGRLDPATQRNQSIPGVMQLLEAHIKKRNSSSRIYNYSGSGWDTGWALYYDGHDTVAELAALTPKIDIIILALGINDAKGGQNRFPSYAANMRQLVRKAIAHDILPVLVKEHPIGNWTMGTPDTWSLMSYWPRFVGELDVIVSEAEFAPYNIPIIDLYGAMSPFDIKLMYDPFHPNAAGYAIMFKAYSEAFDNVVTPSTPTHGKSLSKVNNNTEYCSVR
jgi:hypothetical protein